MNQEFQRKSEPIGNTNNYSLFNVLTLQVADDALEVDAVLVVCLLFLQVVAVVEAVTRVVSATAQSRLLGVL